MTQICLPLTWGLLLCWQTNKSSSFYSLSAAVSARRNANRLLFLTSSSVILLGFSSGLDVIKYQHSSKPWPLAAIQYGDVTSEVYCSSLTSKYMNMNYKNAFNSLLAIFFIISCSTKKPESV
ncbi:MAG: hypothetical protein ABUL44_04260, partial [Flavobacterium sp.]